MMQRVHATESAEVQDFADNVITGNQISAEEFKSFKDQLSEMCKALNSMNDKLAAQDKAEAEAPETHWERI